METAVVGAIVWAVLMLIGTAIYEVHRRDKP